MVSVVQMAIMIDYGISRDHGISRSEINPIVCETINQIAVHNNVISFSSNTKSHEIQRVIRNCDIIAATVDAAVRNRLADLTDSSPRPR